jgi:hypothetical protein
MKLRILSLILFLFTLTAAAQTQKELETTVTEMYANTLKGNFPALLDATYPKLFDIVPKDQMLEILASMMKGEGFTMEILDTPGNFKYGPIKKIAGGTYCMVNHDLKMKMIFEDKLSADDGALMVETFKEGMATDDVTFSEAENAIILKKQADVIAVADALTNNKWTFINKSGGPLMAKIFDPKVVKELGL